MSDVTVTVKESGPYVVSGSISLIDADGNAFPSEREVVALCRCGHSANKPFCDGSHTREGFTATERAGEV